MKTAQRGAPRKNYDAAVSLFSLISQIIPIPTQTSRGGGKNITNCLGVLKIRRRLRDLHEFFEIKPNEVRIFKPAEGEGGEHYYEEIFDDQQCENRFLGALFAIRETVKEKISLSRPFPFTKFNVTFLRDSVNILSCRVFFPSERCATCFIWNKYRESRLIKIYL